MSLASIWRNRKPISRDQKPLDAFHAYITRHNATYDDRDYEVQTDYGELKLCENINIRRAPIATHSVVEVKIREPYVHCTKCVSDIAWLKKMKFGEIVELK